MKYQPQHLSTWSKLTLEALEQGVKYVQNQKDQKSSTCYPVTLFKRDSTAVIFLKIFKLFWTSYFKKQLQTTDCKGFLFAQHIKCLLISWHTRKMEPGTLRWDPGPRALRWEPKVGSQDETLRWDPKVEPYSGILGWDLNVRLVKQESQKDW